MAKTAWEKVVTERALYGVELIKSLSNWFDQMRVEENKMARFITRGSPAGSVLGMWGELGWERIETKANRKKLFYAARFNYSSDIWGREMLKQAKSRRTGWWTQIQSLLIKYNIDEESLFKTSYEDWKALVKEKVNNYEVKIWKAATVDLSTLKHLQYKSHPRYETDQRGQLRCISSERETGCHGTKGSIGKKMQKGRANYAERVRER